MLWSQVAQELVGNVTPELGFASLMATYILVFGSRDALNLGPVALFGSSALVAWCLLAFWSWPPLPAVALSVLTVTLLGVTFDRLSFGLSGRKDLRHAPLIAAIAVSSAMYGLVRDHGSVGQPASMLPALALPWPPASLLPATWRQGLVLAVLALLFWGARWLYGRTRHGRAARALAADRQAAYLLGIGVERTVTLTCVVAAASGAAAAVLATTSVYAVR